MQRFLLGFVMCVGCADASDDGSKADDADGDGIPASLDCNDADPLVGDRTMDADCDGSLAAEDCNDTDPTIGSRSLDADCDGFGVDDDCDDFDPTSLTRSDDADCDGLAAADDCDDNDERIPADDSDCDGLFVADDCDDADATKPALDADCDDVATDDDCDDNDPFLGARSNDLDCDGAVSATDCDDTDPTHGDRVLDADCDRVPTEEDCDDTDAALPAPDDQDCDGATSDVDCSDFDASLGSRENDADCDGVTSDRDCNDEDFTAVETRDDDADCDGIPTADDCDDDDPDLPWPDDLDCDGVLTHPGGGTMVLIEGGRFDMGYQGTESCDADYSYSTGQTSEERHRVTLTRDFYIGVTEVTNLEMEAFSSSFYRYYSCSDDDCPAIFFSDMDVVFSYLNDLSTAFGFTECYAADATTGAYIPITNFLDCDGYRLPTDAEWESAARCGESYQYAGSDTWSDVANWYSGVTDPVASLAPNACGLYDLSGNVSELVNDLFVEDAYGGSSSTDPLGPWPWDPNESAPDRVVRGGDFKLQGNSDFSGCQVALHLRESKSSMGYWDGFRIVRTAP